MSGEAAFFIGDVALDEYYRTASWPAHGTKAILQPIANLPGGMIANAAAVYAALGGRARFCWTMNAGATTATLLSDLEAQGVDTRHVMRDDALGDSKCIIVLTGDDHTVLAPETGLERIRLDDDAVDALLGSRFLYTAIGDMRMLRHGESDAVGVLERARAAGVQVVLDLDVGELQPGDESLLRCVDILFVNNVGFGRLAAGRSEADTIAAVLSDGTSTVIVTRGAEGCDIHTAAGHIHVPGVSVDVVDVTGAGDTFGASYLYAIGRTGDASAAATFANAAAARAVTMTGARAGVASDTAVLDFIRTHQILTPERTDLLEAELAAHPESA
ncbi:carbohydrate kinase family protein [Microbacterium sp. ASV49]|uniref:Carbohydrate kinase family protein n=1 Tax=Microbacterium candidum TaxID=3041922 RepID=A0ABT7N3K4_9MICO|nr:carbohydrate kinase family protein [Microbacterium sp. ASV49]MDL9981266.1 carbohydrate kinase family protein [Microbacterium sp. ASV49]